MNGRPNQAQGDMQLLLRTAAVGIKTPRPPPTPPVARNRRSWQVACERRHDLPISAGRLKALAMRYQIEAPDNASALARRSNWCSALTTLAMAAWLLIPRKDGQAAGFLSRLKTERAEKLFSSRRSFGGGQRPYTDFCDPSGFSHEYYIKRIGYR